MLQVRVDFNPAAAAAVCANRDWSVNTSGPAAATADGAAAATLTAEEEAELTGFV
jgi:hypothetical protein